MQAIEHLENEVMVVSNQSIGLIKDTAEFDAERRAGLQILKKILDNKAEKVMIKGKRHIEFEDWIAIGNAYGVTVRTGDAEPIEIFDAKGFKARAEVIKITDGTVIGGAEAMCLDNERNWRNKDYFQMASMAQTRAGSKALSNVLRFVVALDKSLSGTPAEEMTGMRRNSSRSAPRRDTPKRADKTRSKDDTIMTKAKVKQEESTPDYVEKVVPEYRSLTLEEAASNCKPLRALIKNLKFRKEEVTLDNIKARLNEDLANDKLSPDTYDEIMRMLDRVKQ